jgi:hypothetical protein
MPEGVSVRDAIGDKRLGSEERSHLITEYALNLLTKQERARGVAVARLTMMDRNQLISSLERGGIDPRIAERAADVFIDVIETTANSLL